MQLGDEAKMAQIKKHMDFIFAEADKNVPLDADPSTSLFSFCFQFHLLFLFMSAAS